MINFFLKLIPRQIKTFVLHRIVISVTSELSESWSAEIIEPLYQKITRLEIELEKIKKKLKNWMQA